MGQPLTPFLKLAKFDPVLGFAALAACTLKSVTVASMGQVLKTAAVLYYASTIMTGQLLCPYGDRLSAYEWRDFRQRHRWHMTGFGLPIWALMSVRPMIAIGMMQLFQGASAGLL